MGGRKGRNGLFPATACIKIAGYYGKFTVDVIFWHHLCFVSFISKMNKGKEREPEGERKTYRLKSRDGLLLRIC